MVGGQRSRRARIGSVGVVGALTCLLLQGCGGGAAPPVEAPTPPASSTEVASSSSLPTFASTEASSTDSATPTDAATDEATDEPTDGTDPSADETPKPPVLTRAASGRDLTTADFFKKPDGWQDGRFSAAGKQDLPGVSGTVDDCAEEADEYTPAVELRLANNFSKISMVVAQGDDSEQSDAVLNVRAEGNGTYRDTAHVPFNTTKSFSVPVQGVNAFKLQFWLSGKKCQDEDVRVVLTNLRVE